MKRYILNIITGLGILIGSFFLAILILVTANVLFKTDFSVLALLLLAAIVAVAFWYYYRSSSPEQLLIQKFLVCLVAAIVYTTAIIHIYNVERQNWYEALSFLLLGYIVMVPGFAAGYIVGSLVNENNNQAPYDPMKRQGGSSLQL